MLAITQWRQNGVCLGPGRVTGAYFDACKPTEDYEWKFSAAMTQKRQVKISNPWKMSVVSLPEIGGTDLWKGCEGKGRSESLGEEAWWEILILYHPPWFEYGFVFQTSLCLGDCTDLERWDLRLPSQWRITSSVPMWNLKIIKVCE